MLNDEEKKAIEIIKFLQDKCIEENGTGMMLIYRLDDLANAIEILFNLIEKQSKEIEELKKPKYIIDFKTGEITTLTNDFISKDKIKAKIEELEKQDRMSHNYLVIPVLQSLLEKE